METQRKSKLEHIKRHTRIPPYALSVIEGSVDKYGATSIMSFYDTVVRHDISSYVSKFITGVGVIRSIRQLKGAGLYIYGPSGGGKTILACSILYNFFLHDYIKSGLYVNLSEFLDKIRPGGEDVTLYDRVQEVDLLVVDDLGTQKTTEWVYERLYVIVNRRMEQMLPVIYTSNLSLEEATGVKLNADDVLHGTNEAVRMFNRIERTTAQIFVRGRKRG